MQDASQQKAADPMAPAETNDAGLSKLLGYNLKRVVSLVQADLAQVLVEFDLRIVSFSALSVVVNMPGLNQTALGETLSIERSNIVQIVDDLAGRGLITRAPVAGDRRRHALMPTTTGRKLLASALKAVEAHEARIYSMLTDSERQEMLRLLQKVRDGRATVVD